MAIDLSKLIDINLLSYFKAKYDLLISGKVDKETGKGLSSNDYTSAEKTKLANIASGAQVNTLEGIQKNGQTVTITNKIANISVPTNVTDLADGANYATKNYVDTNGGKIDKIEVNGTEQTIDSTDKSVNISVPTKLTDLTNDGNFVTDASYTHTDSNYTAAEKTKLSGIAANAQVNVLENVKVNGVAQTITNKAVDISVPTATSALTNDSGFITEADIPEGAAASTSTPLMDGTAAVGTSNAFARGDHRHPSDSNKVDKVTGKGLSTEDYTTAEKTKLSGVATGAQVNVLEGVTVNGTAQPIANKMISISVPVIYDSDAEDDSPNKGNAAYVPISYFNQQLQLANQAVTTGLAAKADAADVYTQSETDDLLDEKADASDVYTKTEVNNLINTTFRPGGSVTFSNLPALSAANLGKIVNVTNSFTTTASFVEGAGATYPAGTNVAIIDVGSSGSPSYKYDIQGSFFDLSGFVETSDLGLATNADIDALFE